MNVGELIERLSVCDPKLRIVVLSPTCEEFIIIGAKSDESDDYGRAVFIDITRRV